MVYYVTCADGSYPFCMIAATAGPTAGSGYFLEHDRARLSARICGAVVRVYGILLANNLLRIEISRLPQNSEHWSVFRAPMCAFSPWE